MTFEAALRLTEVLLGWALLQASAEHLVAQGGERWVFVVRGILALMLMAGVAVPVCLLGLCVTALVTLHLFQGPYNGGSDRMGLLILLCLTLAHHLPPMWAETVFAYLAAQLVLSYFISGKVKLENAEWRRGRALANVFAFSAYPVSEGLRRLAGYPRLMRWASWGVIGVEVAFPLALISQPSLIAALTVTALFHFANACLFGLNRFFWTWIAAYPSILWLHMRLVGEVW